MATELPKEMRKEVVFNIITPDNNREELIILDGVIDKNEFGIIVTGYKSQESEYREIIIKLRAGDGICNNSATTR